MLKLVITHSCTYIYMRIYNYVAYIQRESQYTIFLMFKKLY